MTSNGNVFTNEFLLIFLILVILINKNIFSESNSEAELQCFEQLLTAIMSFRDNSSSLTRNDRLTQADQLATAFDDIIIDGISNNDDSSDEGSTSIINDKKM